MKVVFVAPYALPMSIGGFQGQVYHIFEELKNLGIDVCWHNFEKDEINDADILQVMSTDPSMISLIKRSKNRGVKVVLTPMLGSRVKSNRYMKAALFLSKIPQLCSAHKATAEIVRNADYFTPLCSFEANRINYVYGIDANRITVIPNGIDKTFLEKPPLKKTLPFENYILIVGRIEENKNQLNLIMACNALDMNLIIVGEPGSDGTHYLEECRRMAGDNIHFWGLEKNPLVLKYLYQQASLTVIPSYSEMVPLVAFESLSQGTPVICTNRCGITGDVIPGLFFTGISVNAIKKNIEKARLFDKNKISNKGIFSWTDIAEQYVSVYKSVLSKK